MQIVTREEHRNVAIIGAKSINGNEDGLDALSSLTKKNIGIDKAEDVGANPITEPIIRRHMDTHKDFVDNERLNKLEDARKNLPCVHFVLLKDAVDLGRYCEDCFWLEEDHWEESDKH